MKNNFCAWYLGLAALLLGASTPGRAIELTRLYQGACDSKVGFMIGLDKRDLTLLTLSGQILQVPRSSLVGLATYTLPKIAFSSGVPAGPYHWFAFEGFRNGQKISLGQGWLIGFSKEKIELLNEKLEEQIVSRDEIWTVAEIASKAIVAPDVTDMPTYNLRHPLPFDDCPKMELSKSGLEKLVMREGEGHTTVIPKSSFEDPIAIKRHLDAQFAYYQQINTYIEQASFYAVPQKFHNRTFIGTWGIVGSRYANIGARQSNFLPLVEDQFSEGPFGFQRVVRSGVAPLSWGIHEEPVVQLFYGLKADYIHLDVFVDPTAIMIGTQYDWKADQLNTIDDRFSETGGGEFGFDIGDFSLFFCSTNVKAGVRIDNFFMKSEFGLTRAGLSYQRNNFKIAAYNGSTKFEKSDPDYSFDLAFSKIVFDFPLPSRASGSLQLIERIVRDDRFQLSGHYHDKSLTLAIRFDVPISYRWVGYGLFSAESQDVKGFEDNHEAKSAKEIYPKLAGGISYDF